MLALRNTHIERILENETTVRISALQQIETPQNEVAEQFAKAIEMRPFNCERNYSINV
jgi:hypothetical protein